MSTVPAAPATPAPTSHGSFLKNLGRLGKDGLTKVLPFLTKHAQAAEPLVDLLFPMEGPLYNIVVETICKIEVTATQAAQNAPDGPAKMKAVLDAVGPQLLDLAKKHGLVGDQAAASTQRYVQAIFDLLDGPTKKASDPTPATPAAPAAS